MKDLKERLSEFLRQRKYSEKTIELYLNELKCIDIVDSGSRDDFVSFIESTISKANDEGLPKYCINNLRACLHQLLLMNYGVTIKDYRKQVLDSKHKNHLDLILDDFFNYSVNFKSQTVVTAKAEKNHTAAFLIYIGYQSNFDFSSITVHDITGYINDSCSALKNSSKGRYITSIKNFFRYLEYKNIKFSKSIFELPLCAANWKGKMVPVILSDDEQRKIREHFTLHDECGIRNFLIVSFMIDYGLRCAEIPNIMIHDIKWESKLLLVRKTKTCNDRCIPLSNRTLSILETYLIQFRSRKSEYLFTTFNQRKQKPKMNTEEVRGVIRRAYLKENIHGYWKGTHALRRTAASNLFNNMNSFKIVSDILGHESIDSTTSYVKVNFELLRSISSPWPGGEFNE